MMASKLLLGPFRFLAEEPRRILIPVVVYVAALTYMMSQMGHDRVIPDLIFGFTVTQVRDIIQEWKAEEEEEGGDSNGCHAYVTTATLDLFPYMQAYTLTMGSLLILSARRHGIDESLALLMWVVMLLDMGETIPLRRACLSEVSDAWLSLARICNIGKWLGFGLACSIVAISFVMKPSTTKAKSG